ncbi:MAG: sulfite exporter TauE/SafE family protein [Vicinamibacterales bacterium]
MFAFLAGIAAGLLHVVSGPDHLAAVAPLASDRDRGQWLTGLQWGIGHTMGVLLIAALLLLFKEQLPLDAVSAYSERIVGASLIVIGAWGLRRAWVLKCSSAGVLRCQDAEVHSHTHAGASFSMGTIHGLAGSSHLFGVLPALAFPSRAASVLYLAGFGLGAIAGMTAFSAAVGLLSTKLDRRSRRYSGVLYASSAMALVVGGVWLVGQ